MYDRYGMDEEMKVFEIIKEIREINTMLKKEQA